MAAIPETNTELQTIAAIYSAYVAKQEKRFSRRLGASQIGKPCDRALWYGFRWAGREVFCGRMVRLFQRGNLEEHVFTDDLRKIGCEVHQYENPETQQQFEFTAIGGHFVCKPDGVALGIPDAPKSWHILEMKTHNAKSFAALKASNLWQAKPEHYAQCQMGMHLSGPPKIDRCLYIAVNKDTDELYGERIKYDKAEAERLIARAQRIIESVQAPERISSDRENFQCRYCHHSARCHGPMEGTPAVPVQVTCRSCVHSTPVIEKDGIGRWRCVKHNKTISEAEQLRACDDHLFLPSFITFADNQDSDGTSWILYQNNHDGSEWANSRVEGGYTSKELFMLPVEAVGVPGKEKITVDDVKREFGGVVAEVGK